MSHPHPDLAPPAKLNRNGLRIVALGGLGEIGRNMTVFEYRGRLLIVDCGVLFPDPDQPGVDLILPDFGYLDGRLDRVEALVLTHAHEDHVGALPFLMREIRVEEIWATRLTPRRTVSSCPAHSATSTWTSSSRWPPRWSGVSSACPCCTCPSSSGSPSGSPPRSSG